MLKVAQKHDTQVLGTDSFIHNSYSFLDKPTKKKKNKAATTFPILFNFRLLQKPLNTNILPHVKTKTVSVQAMKT